jgi:hypothetical protein
MQAKEKHTTLLVNGERAIEMVCACYNRSVTTGKGKETLPQ